MFPPRRPCPAGGPRLAFCSVVRDERVGAAPGRLVAVGISGSPSATSKSRVLVEHALAQLEARGAAVRLIDVATLPADALLGRGSASQLTDALARVAEARIVVAGTPDRKSTRLNSSHSQISYAVFCLKKKKNTSTRAQLTTA